MKYTTLSSKGTELLENLIVKHGQIVTTRQIFAAAETFLNPKQTEYAISILRKNGWLMPIKKGLYAISDLSTRGFLSVSSFVVAKLLSPDSYVSFESALQYHGMLDQLTDKMISLSLKMHKNVRLGNIEYRFIKTKPSYYFGWKELAIENKFARIATAEKALVDMINFHRSVYAIDLVMEKLREHKKDLDLDLLNTCIGSMSMTTIKIFGFIFDLMLIDSSVLLKLAKQIKGAHFMTANSKSFNAKWRLYYDNHLCSLVNNSK